MGLLDLTQPTTSADVLRDQGLDNPPEGAPQAPRPAPPVTRTPLGPGRFRWDLSGAPGVGTGTAEASDVPVDESGQPTGRFMQISGSTAHPEIYEAQAARAKAQTLDLQKQMYDQQLLNLATRWDATPEVTEKILSGLAQRAQAQQPFAGEGTGGLTPGTTRHVDAKGQVTYSQTAPALGANYEEYTLPDGSRVQVNKATRERTQVSPPIKTAQPLTPEASAAIYAGVKPGELPTVEQTRKMNEYLAARMGGRAGAQISGRFEASLDQPITPTEATLYRMPAGTTRREMLAANPRPITEADIDAGTQFQAAKAMLVEYKDIAGRLLTATDAAGSLGQRVRLAFGAFVRTDEDAVRLRALQATVPLLVRALGEKGTLATADVQRALNAVPDFADTQQSAQAKIAQLEKFIATVEKQIKTLRPGLEGRTGGGNPPPGPPPPGATHWSPSQGYTDAQGNPVGGR